MRKATRIEPCFNSKVSKFSESRRWQPLIGTGIGVLIPFWLLGGPILNSNVSDFDRRVLAHEGETTPGAATVTIVRQGQDDDAYQEEYQKGLELLRQRKYEDALKSFKRANDMREKKSAECFYGMAQAYQGLDAYKNVVSSCEKVIELAGDNPQLQSQAYNLLHRH